MKNIVVLFGSPGVEHDISILTGLHAARHVLDDTCVTLVYLTRDGRLVTSGNMGVLSKIDNHINGKVNKAPSCFFANGCLYRICGIIGAKKVCRVDAVLNCCHGGPGENGCLAGMLEMLNVPVTSCGCEAAAMLQSKTKTREVLTREGFEQPGVKTPSLYFAPNIVSRPLYERGNFPLIVKPDTLGSSIGITVVHDDEQLESALELAFSLDKKVIVEQFLDNAVEINCSAFRFGDKIWVSKCEKMSGKKEFLDFDTKYLDNTSGFSKKRGDEEEPIEREEEIQQLTRKAYELFQCRGVVRADFLIADNKIYLNEINTVPGFLSYHLWLKSGLPYGTLINMLVDQAQVDAQNGLKTAFESEILHKNRILVD